jgi:anti-sigma regulatory factor (Ser/Thr protein kinase)
MPTATLSIPPSVEHVRTARLVAVAAARRAGLDEEAVDDVRLAVGEGVARAVLRHGACELAEDVQVLLHEEIGRFEVEIREHSDADVPDDDDGVALALVRALVPDLRDEGSTLVLTWSRARTP